MIGVSDFFRTSNYIEAVLWGVIGLGFAIAAIRHPGHPTLWIAAAAFAAFGGSDVVETRTGAWWRPWWLLAWKGLCLLVFLILLLRYWRERCDVGSGSKAAPTRARRLH